MPTHIYRSCLKTKYISHLKKEGRQAWARFGPMVKIQSSKYLDHSVEATIEHVFMKSSMFLYTKPPTEEDSAQRRSSKWLFMGAGRAHYDRSDGARIGRALVGKRALG